MYVHVWLHLCGCMCVWLLAVSRLKICCGSYKEHNKCMCICVAAFANACVAAFVLSKVLMQFSF